MAVDPASRESCELLRRKACGAGHFGFVGCNELCGIHSDRVERHCTLGATRMGDNSFRGGAPTTYGDCVRTDFHERADRARQPIASDHLFCLVVAGGGDRLHVCKLRPDILDCICGEHYFCIGDFHKIVREA